MNARLIFAGVAVFVACGLVAIALIAPRLGTPAPVAAPTAVVAPALAAPTANPPTQVIDTQPQAQTTPVGYAVSADQAGTIALNGVPGATLAGTAAIVTYQGVVAYEVPLSSGMAYVDAATGQLLAAAGSGGATGTNTGTGDHGDDDEHDDDD